MPGMYVVSQTAVTAARFSVLRDLLEDDQGPTLMPPAKR